MTTVTLTAENAQLFIHAVRRKSNPDREFCLDSAAYLIEVAIGESAAGADRSLISEDGSTYTYPKDGWVCFHCGERFKTPGGARDHFGGSMDALTGCQIKVGEERGLLMALRKAEDELARYRNEDSDKDREMHAMRAQHAVDLRREEEKGYARGLADAMQLEVSKR